MNVAISATDRAELRSMIASSPHIKMTERESQSLDACLLISDGVYVGLVDGKIACVWGLVPPTLLSTQAYLWLYTSSLVEEHKFLFVRNSQRWIESALEEYPNIVGFCHSDNASAKRWIKWLGGEFAPSVDGRSNFVIRRRHHGS